MGKCCESFGKDLWLMLKKTWLLKIRHPYRLFFEIFIPVLLACILIPVYYIMNPLVVDQETFIMSARNLMPLGDMFAHIQWMGQYIAVVGEDDIREEFIKEVDNFYPGVHLENLNMPEDYYNSFNGSLDYMNIPKLSEIAINFTNEGEFDSYVKSDNYIHGKTAFLAITLNKFDRTNQQYDYMIRYNFSSGAPNFMFESGAVSQWSRLISFDNIDKFISFDYSPFAFTQEERDDLKERAPFTKTQGFITLQSAIDKVILNTPGAIKYDAVTMLQKMLKDSYLLKQSVKMNVTMAAMQLLQSPYNASFIEELKNLLHEYEYEPQSVRISAFPQFAYSKNRFFEHLSFAFGTLFVLAYIYPASWLIRGIVSEKERKIREGMFMMGLNEMSLLWAWLITYFIEFLIMACFIGLIVGLMMEHSNAFFFLFHFLMYGLTVTTFTYMLSTLFSKAKTAGIFGVVFTLAFYFPAIFTSDAEMARENKVGLSFFFPVAFDLGLRTFCLLEADGIGLTVSTFDKQYDSYALADGYIMLAVDCVVYYFIGWYLDKVFPKEYGVTYKWYFLFTKSYWFPDRDNKVSDEKAASVLEEQKKLEEGKTEEEKLHFEEVEPKYKELASQGKCITVKDFYKTFNTPDGIKVAVNHLNMEMYEDQIFVLLGHNGAGKTTTLSILSGLIPGTSGTATMYGYDINTQMNDLRKIMGVCPQHDVLFDELTVKEHLFLFAGLKGMKKEDIPAAADKIIGEIGLREKIDYPSSKLSGGQKRKLSVGIALIGDSKIVFLDEPTSGMDPYSRRSTWSMLQSNKEGRIIILTTHFMDEADLLGDRIAIMHEGKLICCGRPHFLKREYGVGYTLTIVKKDPNENKAITNLLTTMVPEAEILSDVGKEISFRLPFGSAEQFPQLLNEIDDNKDEYGIQSYGMSVTTMEEVFLNSAKMEDRKSALDIQDARKSGSSRIMLSKNYKQFNRAEASTKGMFWIHFKALFTKRLLYVKRDLKGILFQLVIPILLMALGLLLMTFNNFSQPPFIPVSTSYYNEKLKVETNLIGKTYFPYDNSTNLFKQQGIIDYLDPDSLVPISIDASQYFDKDMCYEEEFVRAMGTQSAKVRYCYYLAKDREFAAPLFGMMRYLLDNYIAHESTTYLAAARVLDHDSPYPVTYIFVNTSSTHGSSIGLNLLNEAFLRQTTNNPEASIKVWGSILPFTDVEEKAVQGIRAFGTPMILLLSVAFIPAYYAVFIVRERETSVKHQQLISGVSLSAYWTSTFLWDMLCYVLPCIFGIAFMYIFTLDAYTDNIGAVIVLFILYGVTVAPCTYFICYFFKSHTSAQNIVLFANIFMAILMLVVFVLNMIEDTCMVSRVLEWFFMFFPGYSFGMALLRLSILDYLSLLDKSCDLQHGKKVSSSDLMKAYDAFDFNGVGRYILFLFIQLILYSFLAILGDYILSYPLLKQKVFPDKNLPKREYVDDEDVKKEQERIEKREPHESGKEETIQVRGLRKVWNGKKIAVEDLNFGLIPGTCFGFLGINGAGKTTTLEMLSGDIIPTKGTAKINKLDILTDQIEVRRLLGYCPQFDALLDLLTVKEHLNLFAKIKGVPDDIIDDVVNEKIDQMDLGKFVNKTAGSLSGGNKRKLSVAIALIGNPPLVFLDEPSTGMDPVARRHMWNIIADITIKRCDTTIILTTHSMEEAEALCTLVGIMVGGRLRCLGSIQHLKNRFGQGYMLEIKLKENKEDDIKEIVSKIRSIDGDLIKRNDLASVCKELGDENRSNLINEVDSGWSVDCELNKHGVVSKTFFADWWKLEDRVNELNDTLIEMFVEVELLERHDTYLRFKIDVPNLKLGQLFGLIEGKKDEMSIKEYSFAQTSLEQIFNYFAAEQEEETGEIRGMKKQKSERKTAVSSGNKNNENDDKLPVTVDVDKKVEEEVEEATTTPVKEEEKKEEEEEEKKIKVNNDEEVKEEIEKPTEQPETNNTDTKEKETKETDESTDVNNENKSNNDNQPPKDIEMV